MVVNPPPAIVQPGSTIGILGGGQLGRMATIAAKQMGYRVLIFSPEENSPAGQVADLEICAAYPDRVAVERFARESDVISLEFENIPVETVEWANSISPVRPGTRALQISQNRLEEKNFARSLGIETCEFAQVESVDDLQHCPEILFPGFMKTVSGGYDGKGQVVVENRQQANNAWQEFDSETAILEQKVHFDFEFSVIGARSVFGDVATYPSIRNEHRNQILDLSISPSGIPADTEIKAQSIVAQLLEGLEYIGVLCVEFFYASDGRILLNEMAPRPHNSGHLTIDAFEVSQFEQQVRAICGQPLGSTESCQAAAMANLLGDLWNSGPPAWENCLALSGVKLHLYGKKNAKPGRKMGHLTTIAEDAEGARTLAVASRQRLAVKQETLSDIPVTDDSGSLSAKQ